MADDQKPWEKYASPPVAEPKPWEKYGGATGQPESPQPTSLWDKALDVGGRTLGAFGESINPIPVARSLLPWNIVPTAKGMFNATTEAVGRTREALGRGDYGEAAKSAVGTVPVLGPGLEQITRETTEGKIPEAAGHIAGLVLGPKIIRGAGRLAGAAAGPLAEAAVGLTSRERPAGVPAGAIGKEVLARTSGIRPATVAATGGQALSDLSQEAVRGAQAGGIGSLVPARTTVANAINRAQQFSDPTAAALEPMQRFLTEPGPNYPGMVTRTGEIAPAQDAADLLEMRKRFNEAFGGNRLWRAQTPREAQNVAKRTYGALTGEVHNAAPLTVAPDQAMRLLIPGVQGAERAARAPSLAQSTLARIARPTGALVGAGLGYATHGPAGMLVGLTVPELISNPAARMAAARILSGGGRFLQNPDVAGSIRLSPFLARAQEQEGNQ